MKIIGLLKKDTISFSFEAFPPKTESGFEGTLSAAREIARLSLV